MTLSDWRDPLDPDCEAQMIYSQLLLSRDELKRKYAEAPETTSEVESGEPRKSDVAPSKSSDARAAATRLFEVIDELEEAHEKHELRKGQSAEHEAK